MKTIAHRRITSWLALGIVGVIGAVHCLLVGVSVVAPRAAADNSPAAPLRIIIDSDFKTMADDGQALAMAAQLQAQSALQIMGLCVVSGNDWEPQEAAEALKAVERLGIENTVGVYPGADTPLDSDVAGATARAATRNGYLGALGKPWPAGPADLLPPPDGFATHTAVRGTPAADFIAETVRAHPHEITILAIGPLTDIAAAATAYPDIVGLIKEIVYMGGAFDVPGNTTATAEFNWWFDPLAARQVLRLPVRHVILPLDLTDSVMLSKPVYDQIAHAANLTVVTELFRQQVGRRSSGTRGFDADPRYVQPVWDATALAYAADPSLATESHEAYVDVDPFDGRSFSDTSPTHAGLQKATIITRFDNPRFFDFYVDLLTGPVPVRADIGTS
jgi:inosine-uridine nucleoside N-ribohydrolase